jgi:hypothetical protein
MPLQQQQQQSSQHDTLVHERMRVPILVRQMVLIEGELAVLQRGTILVLHDDEASAVASASVDYNGPFLANKKKRAISSSSGDVVIDLVASSTTTPPSSPRQEEEEAEEEQNTRQPEKKPRRFSGVADLYKKGPPQGTMFDSPTLSTFIADTSALRIVLSEFSATMTTTTLQTMKNKKRMMRRPG